ARPGEDVVGTGEAADAGGDGVERGVAGLGAAVAVERPEAVDVDQGQADRAPVSARPLELAGCGLAERVEDEEVGARVAPQAVAAVGLQLGDPLLGGGQFSAQSVDLGFAEHSLEISTTLSAGLSS